jgi:NAD(P)-dependent dehydrogenase (short-subunit alcohol dehydrogenase family)
MSKVLVTGTSSGIGFQTAIVLGRAGHRVCATMRNLERSAALRELVEKERLPITIAKMDVDSDDSVNEATSVIRAQAGHIDALVNNAGIEHAGSQIRRFGHMFEASLEKPTPPTIVAEKIRETHAHS